MGDDVNTAIKTKMDAALADIKAVLIKHELNEGERKYMALAVAMECKLMSPQEGLVIGAAIMMGEL